MRKDNSNKIILDLCSGTGNWSLPYKRAGYRVITIDLPTDVRLIPLPDEPVYGVLAAPPCTIFSLLNNYRKVKRTDQELIEALSVVDACLRLVIMLKPKFWALENPKGFLSKYLGKPKYMFNPSDFGHPYTKLTYLWGDFNIPKTNPTGTIIKNYIKNMPPYKDRQARRAMTPYGFAKAFYQANK